MHTSPNARTESHPHMHSAGYLKEAIAPDALRKRGQQVADGTACRNTQVARLLCLSWRLCAERVASRINGAEWVASRMHSAAGRPCMPPRT
jgi:hypothetical protein